MKSLKVPAFAGVLSASLFLAGCQGANVTDSVTGAAESQAENMGNATPAVSPPAVSPAGTVHPYEAVIDVDATGDLLAVRTAAGMTVGTLDEVLDGSAADYPLDAACGDVSARDGKFAVACGSEVRIIEAAGESSFPTAEPASVAAVTSTGEVLTGSADERTIRVYRDGAEIDSFSVARETDQLLTVPRAGQPDTAVRVNHFDTTIQDLDLSDIGNGRQGGTLRVGLGVGGVAAGGDGLVLAADNTGDQLLVYTATDIIRLQQSAPVAASPWGVAWDGGASLAWVTSTATNTAMGYDISQGVPLERASVPTVADARNIVALADGTLVVASASGGGLQILSPADKSAQLGAR